MNKAILGKKIGMMQIFTDDGIMLPVTVVEAGPCDIVQKKTVESDGYNAVQICYGDIREKLVTKPLKGHFAKVNLTPKRYLREFRFDDISQYEVSGSIKCEVFEAGDKVDISGVSKGKGFAGVIKRWNFARGRMSHGGGPVHRSVGSIGACATPGRVFKRKKMPGHMGAENVTIQNLEVVRVDAERNLLLIKGAIPGPKGGLIAVKESIKK